MEFREKDLMGACDVVLIGFYDLDSLSVRILHAYLRKAGVGVRSVFLKRPNRPSGTMDYPTRDEVDALVGMVKGLKPVLVGISVRSTFFKLAAELTARIKREIDAAVAWGGIHPTIRPHQCIELADIVCVGEGGEAIVELAVDLLKGEPIDGINNLWIKKGDSVLRNRLRPLIKDIDSVPYPDFSEQDKYLVEHGKVLNLPSMENRTEYPIMTSRGCPYKCTYCHNSVLRRTYTGLGRYVRRRSVGDVISELTDVKSKCKNLSYIRFWDDLFAFDVDWIRRFCPQYKKQVNIPFYCLCHPKTTDDEIVNLLKDAGAYTMQMGIQSGSEQLRHRCYERFETNEEILAAARILSKCKVNCVYDLILDNPFEAEDDRRETLDLLLELPRPFQLRTFTLTHFPETKLTQTLLAEGMISEDDVEDQKQQSYRRFGSALDLRRSKENLFWDNLYYLASRTYLPKRLVGWMSRRDFLRRHSQVLTFFVTLVVGDRSAFDSSRVGMARWYVTNLPRLLFRKEAWLTVGRILQEKLTTKRSRKMTV